MLFTSNIAHSSIIVDSIFTFLSKIIICELEDKELVKIQIQLLLQISNNRKLFLRVNLDSVKLFKFLIFQFNEFEHELGKDILIFLGKT